MYVGYSAYSRFTQCHIPILYKTLPERDLLLFKHAAAQEMSKRNLLPKFETPSRVPLRVYLISPLSRDILLSISLSRASSCQDPHMLSHSGAPGCPPGAPGRPGSLGGPIIAWGPTLGCCSFGLPLYPRILSTNRASSPYKDPALITKTQSTSRHKLIIS